jgi:YVTN family beta-propeller protein
MTIKLNDITTDPTASTVLDYSIITNPDPLQISSTGSISITVSKAVSPAVQCTSLVFSVSVGDAAADLTANPSAIETQCPSDQWSEKSDGAGTFTFTYLGNSEIGKDGLLFVLSNIAVNDQVGTSYLSITENLQSGTNKGALPLPKFPANFTVSDLTADSYNISPGGTVNLSWDGSSGGNYSLSYDGEPDGKPVSVPDAGTYPVDNLRATTTFTLTVTAEGGTIQLVRQCIVTVEQPVIEEFGVVGNSIKVPIGSTFQLCWTTENADQCILGTSSNPNVSEVPANSTGYPVTAPKDLGTYSYTLTPVGSNGQGGVGSTLAIQVYAPPVQFLSFGIVGNPSAAPTGGSVKLYWSTQGATACDLVLNGETIASNLPANVDANQGYAFTLPNTPGTATFVLSAYYEQQSVGSSNPVSISVFPFQFVTAIGNTTSNPAQMLMSPDGSRLYVAGDTLTVIDTASNTVIQTINLSMPPGFLIRLTTSPIALSPDGSHLYFAPATDDGVLKVVDTSTWQIQSITVPGANYIFGVAMGAPPYSSYPVVNSGDFDITRTGGSTTSTLYALNPSSNYSVAAKMETNVLIQGLATATQSPEVDIFCVGSPTSDSGPSVFACQIRDAAFNPVDSTQVDLFIDSPSLVISPGYIAGEIMIASLVDEDPGHLPGNYEDYHIQSITCSVDGNYLYCVMQSPRTNNFCICRIDANALQQSVTVYSTSSALCGATVSPDGKHLYVGNTNQVLIFNIS